MAETVKKAWGYEVVLCNEPEYCRKDLHINPRKKCSLHYHPIKKETFLLKSGSVVVQSGETEYVMLPGFALTIPPGTKHRFWSHYGGVLEEISTHHSDEDVVRLEPSGDL